MIHFSSGVYFVDNLLHVFININTLTLSKLTEMVD